MTDWQPQHRDGIPELDADYEPARWTADSIAARLTPEQRDRIEQAVAERMMRESELGTYDAAAVAELARHVI